jgi:hypothetical protein
MNLHFSPYILPKKGGSITGRGLNTMGKGAISGFTYVNEF